jgi:SAM-dependent methyltransferase
VACKTQPQVPERLQRLVFGEDAELYEAHRPSYPAELIDDLVGWTGPERRALEVGAGTGKATRLVAARRVQVTAIEPSAEMAAVAQRTLAPGDRVEFVVSDFEHAELGGRQFPLLYAAQAWHWVEQPAGYARARQALEDGGRLVVFWNRPDWPASALRDALDAAFERIAPDMPDGPLRGLHRDAESSARWEQEIGAVEGFAEPETRRYDWTVRYTADAYVENAATHSDIRLLDVERRRALLHAIGEAITAQGGSFELPMYVRVCVARAL